MLISVFLYLVIYMAFGNLYNAFKIGTYKITELILSQLLAFGIADMCLYLECCLIHSGVVDIRPGIVAVLIQLLGSILLIVSAKHYFLRNIPPQQTILVYGGGLASAAKNLGKRDSMAQEDEVPETVFEEKIRKKLPHMFQIRETVPDGLPMEDLLNKIKNYDTVMLYQVEEDIRVQLLAESIQMGKNIYTTPRIEDILLTNFENRHMIDTPLLKAKTGVSEYWGKRILDIIMSSLMLLLFSPFMLVIAAAIKLEDGDVASSVSVDLEYKIELPIRLLGDRERLSMKFKTHTEVPVGDSPEFIRNVNMVDDIFEVTGAKEAMTEKIKELRKFVRDLFHR